MSCQQAVEALHATFFNGLSGPADRDMYFRFKTLCIDHVGLTGPTGPRPPPSLGPATRRRLIDRQNANFDWSCGGPRGPLRYLDIDAFEYTARSAARGDPAAAIMARMSIHGALQLIDPDDGGVRQYATGPGWRNATTLKTLRGQACMLHALAIADNLLDETTARAHCDRILEFTLTRLRADDGLLWSEAPPDRFGDKRRVVRATTRTRDNAQFAYAAGAAARTFCAHEFAAVANDVLTGLIAGRRLVDGGFGGFGARRGPLSQADTLSSARALALCHTLDRGRGYLELAQEAMSFIELNFRCASTGYYSTTARDHGGEPLRDIDENVSIARGAASMLAAGGGTWLKRMAHHALRYLCHPAVALSRTTDIGILLAEESVQQALAGDLAFEEREFGARSNRRAASPNIIPVS